MAAFTVDFGGQLAMSTSPGPISTKLFDLQTFIVNVQPLVLGWAAAQLLVLQRFLIDWANRPPPSPFYLPVAKGWRVLQNLCVIGRLARNRAHRFRGI